MAPDDEEYVTLYLHCRDGVLDGYMMRNIDESMIFPTLTANSGFSKTVRFFRTHGLEGKE